MKSSGKRFALVVGLGCLAIIVLVGLVTVPLLVYPLITRRGVTQVGASPVPVTPPPGARETQQAIPTLPVETAAVATAEPSSGETASGAEAGGLSALYEELNPGVVSIQVLVERGGLSGQGAGSGFILDTDGHIVTNNHVVASAERITVIFYNGLEARAESIGLDDDSDLAVIRVDELPTDVHPLPLGDSDDVRVGESVVAIGNPFSLGGSMSLGIVSAVGRSLPSGVARYTIPEAIQTDAAINPGNSGGPLLNLSGEVIGVNAQIASAGVQANAGVGFAIPVNIVRRVVPVLIANGTYVWPWLGIEGGSVSLLIAEANGLDTQLGAYVSGVVPDGPADQAGLTGSSSTTDVDGLEIPVGGDVVVEADGMDVDDFEDLLAIIAAKNPEDAIDLKILRDGEEQAVAVTLSARPE